MKSIFKYCTIILMNFTAFQLIQASNQPRDQIIASQEPKPTAKNLLQHVRTLSMRQKRATSQENDSIPEHHSDNESSSSSHSSNHERIELVRKLSQCGTRILKPEQKITPISRNYFSSIEKVVGLFVLSAGVYKIFNFVRPSQSNQQRSGLPTDMVGAAFWGVNFLSRFASSGFTLVIAAYAGHKAKGFVDGLYENRFNKMLQPIRTNIEELAGYVDERINPIAKGQIFLCDVTEDMAQSGERFARSQQENILILRVLTNNFAQKHPTTPEALQLTDSLEKMEKETTQVIEQAHDITERIEEERKSHAARLPAINPITSKEKSGKCCGARCTIM